MSRTLALPITATTAEPRVRYREVRAVSELSGVDAVWSLRVVPGADKFPHRPPSCGGLQVIYDVGQRHLWIKGPHNRPEIAELRPGSLYCGLRLRAGAASWLMGRGVEDVHNHVASWRDVVRDPWWTRLVDALAGRTTAGGVLATLVDHLHERPNPQVDRVVAHACRLLRGAARHADEAWSGPGRGSVTAVADAVGLSNRQLLRRFSGAVGMRPKEYQQAVRVAHCARLVLRNPRTPLAQVACGVGFSDQAHLTRVFRNHIGIPPRGYAIRYRGTEFGQSVGTESREP